MIGAHFTRRVVCAFLAAVVLPALGAGASSLSNPITQLPKGPDWAARDSCISPTKAAARAREGNASLPSWHVGASLKTAISFMTSDTKGKASLCHWGNDGWLVVPAGWHERTSSVGEDGGGIWRFESATGPRRGWAEMVDIPACVGCMIGNAQGLFSDARAQEEAMIHARVPAETLSPKPDTLERPNRCVVYVTYHSDGLEVVGQVYWDHINMDDGYVQIFIALPPADAPLRNAMFASFWSGSPTQRRCPSTPPAAPPASYPNAGQRRKSPIHWPTVHYLPVTKERHSGLVRVVARDASGNALTAVDAWAPKSVANKLPPLTFPIPAELQHRITLMGSPTGWSVEPKRWILYTRNDYVPTGIETSAWIAPGGAENGWQIRVSDNFQMNYGASRFALDGLFSGGTPPIHDTHGARMQDIDLAPRPESLTHPNACTALITYRISGLVVKGVVHLEPRSLLRGVFIAMPPADAKVQELLLKSFSVEPSSRIHHCTLQKPLANTGADDRGALAARG